MLVTGYSFVDRTGDGDFEAVQTMTWEGRRHSLISLLSFILESIIQSNKYVMMR